MGSYGTKVVVVDLIQVVHDNLGGANGYGSRILLAYLSRWIFFALP